MWQVIVQGVSMYRDSCNVYAVDCPDGIVVVNAGTGAWLESIESLGKPVIALICTHYFRDHASGASDAANRGIPVFVPEYEADLFRDPSGHFGKRESYIVYDNLWDRFSPIEPISIKGLLRDYEAVNLAGREFEVIPLPGVSCGQIGLGTTFGDGRRVVFSAEAIHSPGRMARIAPLQYNYNDLSGAVSAYDSAARLIKDHPDCLLPSLGVPILSRVEEALVSLKENLKGLLAVRSWAANSILEMESEDLEQVTEHVWRDRKSVANTWYLVADSGKILAIDYGYALSTACAFPGYPKRDRRRALLHGQEALRSKFGTDRIDVVLVSHFHDDHVCGIPVLQRIFGTECWAAESFADLLDHPEAHNFPCNWPVPCRVTRRLALEQAFEWEGFTFHLGPMSGHTRFSALIGFEADGKRFAHTGDQYFFEKGVNSFEDNFRSQNHVFRNGALLDGYEQSGNWMLEWRPEIVLQGHQPAMVTDAHFFRHVAEWTSDYAGLAQQVMPLGDDEIHFNLDSWGGWIWPYRVDQHGVDPFTVKVIVRNPLPVPAELKVELQGPAGWKGESILISAGSREEVACFLTMIPTDHRKSQPIAAALTANGQPFGQIAEAIVNP